MSPTVGNDSFVAAAATASHGLKGIDTWRAVACLGLRYHGTVERTTTQRIAGTQRVALQPVPPCWAKKPDPTPKPTALETNLDVMPVVLSGLFGTSGSGETL